MPRSSTPLRRRPGQIPPRKRILIVCEGAKTEPNYFEALKLQLRAGTLAIEIYGEECGSDPVSVVEYAKEKKAEARKKQKKSLEPEYDEIWCVIDVDQHPTLSQALSRAAQANLKIALSNPCFEYWLLLHHRDTNRPYSDCDALIRDLKTAIPNYAKGNRDLGTTLSLTQHALDRATKFERLRPAGDTVRNSNSSTDVHKLVHLIHQNSIRPYDANK